ncbi:unnamed protein product [Spodoptera exigua]|nr:unnamed protein product [Spodoptera exigua]
MRHRDLGPEQEKEQGGYSHTAPAPGHGILLRFTTLTKKPTGQSLNPKRLKNLGSYICAAWGSLQCQQPNYDEKAWVQGSTQIASQGPRSQGSTLRLTTQLTLQR